MSLVLSDPGLTGKKLANHVNKLAGVFRTRMITRDRSVLEVVAAVTGPAHSSPSLRSVRSASFSIQLKSETSGTFLSDLRTRALPERWRLTSLPSVIPSHKGKGSGDSQGVHWFNGFIQCPAAPRSRTRRPG